MRHNKLVRDHIPAIITRGGEHPVTRILDVSEYGHELRRKLHEEVEEFDPDGEGEYVCFRDPDNIQVELYVGDYHD